MKRLDGLSNIAPSLLFGRRDKRDEADLAVMKYGFVIKRRSSPLAKDNPQDSVRRMRFRSFLTVPPEKIIVILIEHKNWNMKVLEIPATFSNLQKELLKLFAANVPEEDLLQIRLLISNYFADKSTNATEQFLKEKNISTTEYNNWENEHNRGKSSLWHQYIYHHF